MRARLIQMNDPRENIFTSETIKRCEFLTAHVGVVTFNSLEMQKDGYYSKSGKQV